MKIYFLAINAGELHFCLKYRKFKQNDEFDKS